MTTARERYAALLREAKGQISGRALATQVGLGGTTVHEYVTGKALPSPDVHAALVRATTSTSAERFELEGAYAAAVEEKRAHGGRRQAVRAAPRHSDEPLPGDRILLCTIGSALPVRLVTSWMRLLESYEYCDVQIDNKGQITARKIPQ